PGVKEDGAFHPISVRVNRPGLEVRTRKGYYDPTEKERKATAANGSADLSATIAGVLPKADVPMDVSVAPFATPDGKGTLAIVVNVNQPSDVTQRGQAHTEQVDVIASLFNPESGRGMG